MSPGDEHETSGGYGGTGQTRTRLPQGTGGDIYGGARRGGRSSSKSLVTVVGVVVVLIAAIAFANRGDGTSSSNDSSTSNGSKPDAASTAASGTKPVETKTGGFRRGSRTPNRERSRPQRTTPWRWARPACSRRRSGTRS